MATKKIKFRTPYNYEEEQGKKFPKPTLTEPDLNLTVREILTKFTHGGLPHIGLEGFDDQDVTFDDYQRYMDMDYDLEDMTIDKIRISEIKADVDKTIALKEEKRKKQSKQEAEELQKLRSLRDQYEKGILKKEPDTTE